MITRRTLLRRALQLGLASVALGGYAVAGEPFRLRIQRYRPRPPDWPDELGLRIAVLADLHACRPWMGPGRIKRIVSQTNALNADLIVLLGDYAAGHRFVSASVHSSEWAPILGGLTAPLGVHAVLGNHDWWDDRRAQREGHGPTIYHRRLADAGINVLENRAVRIRTTHGPFWLRDWETSWLFRRIAAGQATLARRRRFARHHSTNHRHRPCHPASARA